MKKQYINLLIFIITVIIGINLNCNSKIEKRVKYRECNENWRSGITNRIDKKIVNIIEKDIIPDRKIIDLIAYHDNDETEYWILTEDNMGKIYCSVIAKKDWFNSNGDISKDKKKLRNYITTTHDEDPITKEFIIVKAKPIAYEATNTYILSNYQIKICKLEIPVAITKVSNRPNTNIFIATIGFNRREEFTDHGIELPTEIKANFYVYEIIDGKAKKVYEDLRCGDGLLKNGLVIKRGGDKKLLVYLFIKTGNADTCLVYLMRDSNTIRRLTWGEIEKRGEPYNPDLIYKEYHISEW